MTHEQFNQLIGPIVLLGLLMVGLGAFAVIARKFFRSKSKETTATSSLMSSLREMQETGELSEEEYRILKSQLNSKFATELDVKLSEGSVPPRVPPANTIAPRPRDEEELEEIPIEPDAETLALLEKIRAAKAEQESSDETTASGDAS